MRQVIGEAHQLIKNLANFTLDDSDWAQTPKYELGDIAIPCFKMAKLSKKKPADIAVELASEINANLAGLTFLKGVKAVGPYLNFYIDHQKLFGELRNRFEKDPFHFGSSALATGETIVIDFSSPNVAKEIALHHLRSTAIGNALANIAEIQGAHVVRINYLGDWGTSFGKYLVALKLWGDEKRINEEGSHYLMELYVRFNKEAKARPGLDDQAREAFKDLENGNEEYVALWKRIRHLSIAEFEKLYQRLGIKFDYYDGEAMYVRLQDGVVEEISRSIGTRLSDGALVCDLVGHKIPILLKKNDGASLYITRDICAAADRYQRFHFTQSWYVVGIQQKLHFLQLKDLLSALKRNYAEQIEHVPFGMLSFGEKTMATREGNIVVLSEALDEGQKKALAIIQDKNPDLANAEMTADMISTGAFIFFDLSQHRKGDVKFEWSRALNFEGDTSPFLQYTIARCSSLLDKSSEHFQNLIENDDNQSKSIELFDHSAVKGLVNEISFFQNYLERSYLGKDPSQVAISLLRIAKAMNHLYHSIRFLEEDNKLKLEHLRKLTELCRGTLKFGLSILGIHSPDRM